MLYDPKWDQPIKRKSRNFISRWIWPVTPREVFSVSDFAAWAATQSPTKRYQYIDPIGCALAQYLQARGVRELNSIVSGYGMTALHPKLLDALCPGESNEETFGALAGRLLSMQG